MEIRVKYEDGKASAILIQDNKDQFVDNTAAVSACLEELYALLSSIARENLKH